MIKVTELSIKISETLDLESACGYTALLKGLAAVANHRSYLSSKIA
jgi:hypothetical protein